MEVKITPRNVMAVVVEVDRMLKAKSRDIDLNQAEVMLGLQELVGRIIVDMASTQPGAMDLADHAKKHLDATIRIGMATKGQPVGQA
jgi:hypothetical protein